MGTAPANPIPSEPRRFEIRLPRPLWIGLVAAVIAVASVALRIGLPIYRQRLAIQELNRAYAHMLTNERGPRWLRRWLGTKRMRCYDEIVQVMVSGQHADDALVSNFSSLKNLRWVVLNEGHVTDAGLMQLRGISTLETLEIESPWITDAGLQHLRGLSKLSRLRVRGTQITDEGVADLQRALPGLTIVK